MSDAWTYPALSMDALTEGVLARRVVAWVIDFVLIGVTGAALWVVLLMFGVLTLGLGLPLLGLLPVVPFAYHTLFVASSRSATPGQSMLDLVVRREVDLGPPTPLQALVFTGGLWATFATGLVLLAVALVTSGNRALHDIVSGLVVVRKGALNGTLTGAPGSVNMRGGTSFV